MMNKLATYIGILVLIGAMAVPVYAKWGNHGSMKGSGNRSGRVEYGSGYPKLSAEEQAAFEGLRRTLKADADKVTNEGMVEQQKITPISNFGTEQLTATQEYNDGKAVQSKEKDQNLPFNPSKVGTEKYLSGSCGTGHPKVTGGSCHM
jgi:hypothetical protein